MDDKNQPLNQLNNQPKDDQQADVSSSAPVEMEPPTQGAPVPPSPQPPVTPPVSPAPPVVPPMNQPETSMQPGDPQNTPTPMAPQQQLLEAPKKKNGMFIAVIAVALVVVLALLGMVVYNALY